MMKINLTDIPLEGLEFRYDEDPRNLYLSDETIRFSGVIAIHMRIGKIGDIINIDGGINASMIVECSRCLKDSPYPINSDFYLEYSPMGDAQKAEVYRIKKADLETDYYTGDSILLDDIVREQITLSIPISPVCNKDCKGLCPTCGVNLNIKGHECKKVEIDPRFSVLKDFLKKK